MAKTVKATKMAFHFGRRIRAGELVRIPDRSKVPSWAVLVGDPDPAPAKASDPKRPPAPIEALKKGADTKPLGQDNVDDLV